MTRMRISVLGAGAMGSLFGGLLSEQHHDVELLDVDAALIEHVRSHGLVLETDVGGSRVVRLPIMRPDEALTRPDCMIVLTKTMHTTSALAYAQQILHDELLVLTLQNGLGNVERVTQHIPLCQVAVGVTTVPADTVGLGHVRSNGAGQVRLMMASNEHSDKLAALSRALSEAGLSSAVDDKVNTAIWEKVAFNAALNAVCAMGDCNVGQVGRTPGARALAHRIADEVIFVALESGLRLDAAAIHATMNHALDTQADHRPSMLQDLQAGRATEIDAINGAVLRIARNLGVAVPCTETVDTLVRLRERADRTCGRPSSAA